MRLSSNFAATRWIRHENKSALINEELSVQSEIQTTHVRQTTPLPTPRHLRHTGTRSASKQLCARAQYKDRTKPFTLIHLFNIFVLLSFFRTLRVSPNSSNSSPDRADNLSARRAVIYCESWIRAEPRELTGNTRLRWWAAVKDHICRIGGIPCCQR